MPTPIRTKFLETVVLDIDFSSHTLQSFMHSFPSRCIPFHPDALHHAITGGIPYLTVPMSPAMALPAN